MGKALRIGTDLHIFGPHELYKHDDPLIFKCDYLLGDIVEMFNCKKKDVEKAKAFRNYLVKLYRKKFVFGNHEIDFTLSAYEIIEVDGVRILLCHGHIPIWGEEKSMEWTTKKYGAGFIKRAGSFIFNKWRDIFGGFKITEEDLYNLEQYAKKHNCQHIICGHKHPKENFDETRNGIRITILSRGIHTINV
jgi:predicted phosphodiesterase